MKVFISPISGGAFPSQLALMCEAGIKPDLCFGSSGGNISNYLWMACRQDQDELKKMIQPLETKMFITGSPLVVLFKGSYLPGEGAEDFFINIFSSDLVKEYEIITSAYDMKTNTAIHFSNMGKDDSFFKENYSFIDYIMYHTKELVHLDGDTRKIAQASIGSAAVPGMAPAQPFDEYLLVDGGVSYASGFVCFEDQLLSRLAQDEENIQLIYFGSANLETAFQDATEGNKRDFFKGIRVNILYNILKDRTQVIKFLEKMGGNIKCESKKNCDKQSLQLKLEELKEVSYCLILYPNQNEQMDLRSFTYHDIIKLMDKVKLDYSYYLWYQSSSSEEDDSSS